MCCENNSRINDRSWLTSSETDFCTAAFTASRNIVLVDCPDDWLAGRRDGTLCSVAGGRAYVAAARGYDLSVGAHTLFASPGGATWTVPGWQAARPSGMNNGRR